MHTSRQQSPKKLLRFLAVVAFLLASIASAQADPITVSGTATLTSGVASEARGPVLLTGTNFSTNLITVGGNFGLGDCSTFLTGLNGPCTGANVGWISIGTDLIGTFTVNGVTLNSNIINQMGLMFTGPSFAIPAELLGASAIQVTAPFTFSGSAVSPALSEAIVLQGEGTVYVILVRRTIGNFTGFFLDHADYVFGATVFGVTIEEVPEPATLLLLVSGLGGTAIYRRRKKSAK